MPEQAAHPLASMLLPFGISRDTLAQADERLSALGAGLGEAVEELAQRLNTLPASAAFQPFGGAAQGGLANVVQGIVGQGKPQRGSGARQARRAIRSAASQGVQSAVNASTLSRAAGSAFSSPAVAKAIEQMLRQITEDPPRKTTRRKAAGQAQDAARAAEQAARERSARQAMLLPVSGQLAADLVSQLLRTLTPAASTLGGLPIGQGLGALVSQGVLGQPGLGNAVQDAVADALAGITSPQKRPRKRATRNAGQAAVDSTGGVFGKLSIGELIGPMLDAITKGKPAAAQQGARHRPRRAADPMPPAAPRAPTRLLPPATGSAPEAAATGTPPANLPASSDDCNAALDELHRALLDQAWLRGVDLR